MRKKTCWLLLALCIFWAASLGAQTRVAYVFSGGGARAFAHIGILKVLEANGFKPDIVTGTSMGAVVGALYSMGYDASKIQELLVRLAQDKLLDDSFRRKELYIGQKRWAPYGIVNLEMDKNLEPRIPSSIWVGNSLNLELARMFAPAGADIDFNQLPIPFGCVATDLVSGEPVFFRQGNLMQAVRASLSIPSLIQPFELDGKLYIDGGVSQNLPSLEAKEMGADIIIGIKTNSTLRKKEELGSFIQVLDQTINIGMTRNISQSLESCDLLLEPDLEGFGSMDYRYAAQIAAAGEEYALANLDRILAFQSMHQLKRETQPIQITSTATAYPLRNLTIKGNKHLSPAKIKEYLGLEPGTSYTVDQIIEACRQAWNSQLFQTIYPLIQVADGSLQVTVQVKELTRRQIGINFSYNSEDGFQANGIFKMNNILLKNSSLHAALTLGGVTEYDLDYVKNFGELWGSYFRVFQYYSQKRKYYYDADFHKRASVKSAELGINGGVGVFASKLIAAEAFIYGFHTRLYREISSVAELDSTYLVSGAGIKAYHESLDDYYFPMSGIKATLKFNFARSTKLSDYIYSKVHGSAVLYSSISDWLSLKTGMEIGSWLGGHEINADPFYIGGSTGFMGYQKYELSAPVYKFLDLGLTAMPRRNFFLNTGIQGLNIDSIDAWGTDQTIIWGIYGGFGFKSALGPLRFTVAIRENGRPNYYVNLGYDLDVFHFSRR